MRDVVTSKDIETLDETVKEESKEEVKEEVKTEVGEEPKTDDGVKKENSSDSDFFLVTLFFPNMCLKTLVPSLVSINLGR